MRDRRRDRSPATTAHVRPDGTLRLAGGFEGSIHQAGSHLMGGTPYNGWDHWYFESSGGQLRPIDDLRDIVRARQSAATAD